MLLVILGYIANQLATENGYWMYSRIISVHTVFAVHANEYKVQLRT